MVLDRCHHHHDEMILQSPGCLDLFLVVYWSVVDDIGELEKL